MSKQKQGGGSTPKIAETPAKQAEIKRAAKARQRRGAGKGQTTRAAGDHLFANIWADKIASREEAREARYRQFREHQAALATKVIDEQLPKGSVEHEAAYKFMVLFVDTLDAELVNKKGERVSRCSFIEQSLMPYVDGFTGTDRRRAVFGIKRAKSTLTRVYDEAKASAPTRQQTKPDTELATAG